MLFNLFIFIIITNTQAQNCDFNNTLTSEQLFECLDNHKISEENVKQIKQSFTQIFNSYVYKDIMKNPPQPEGYTNYHQKVDLDEMFDSIEEKEQVFYPMYQKISKTLFDLHDYHVYFTMTSSVDYEYLVDYFCILLPFYIQYTDDKKIIFYPLLELILFDIELPQEIITNHKSPIVSVDGMNVVDWLQSYSDKYVSLKNPHARYTYGSLLVGMQYLNEMPMTKEEIDHVFVVEYENGVVLNISQIIANFGPLKGNKKANYLRNNERNHLKHSMKNKNKKNTNESNLEKDEKEIKDYEYEFQYILENEENIETDNFDKYNQLLKEIRNIENPIDEEINSQIKTYINEYPLKGDAKEQSLKREKLTKKYQQLKQRQQIIDSINKKRSERKFTNKPVTSRDMLIENVIPSLKQTNQRKQDATYDYLMPESIGCKVTEVNNETVNLFYIPSFAPEEEKIDTYITVFDNCVKKIDENNAPIVIVLAMNGGGYVDLEAYVEKTFAPKSDCHQYGSMRIHDQTLQAMKNGYNELFTDPETCEYNFHNESYHGDFYDNPTIDHFGSIEHIRTQTKRIMTFGTDSIFVKNPRKPTDIVVFTDSFCFSACSIFAKGMVEKGGAITAGFFGNPHNAIDKYDAGQSPTLVISAGELLSEDDYFNLTSYGFDFQVSFAETYRYDYTYQQTIPREFLIDEIDEYVFLAEYDDDKMQEFAEEGMKIHKKYQEECNPKNKRLVKVTSECDKYMTIEHAHGGYVCGEDGKWSTECVPTYCDEGYYFDFINLFCYQEKCNYTEEVSSSTPPSDQPVQSETQSSNENNQPMESEHTSQNSQMDKSSEYVVLSEFSADHTEAWYSYLLISVISIFIILIIISFLGVGLISIIKSRKEKKPYMKMDTEEGLM